MFVRAKMWGSIPGVGFAAILCLLVLVTDPAAEPLDGQRVMEEVFRRQRLLPCVYEELTLVLRDRGGNREVRRARRFFRAEEDGAAKDLLVFDTPAEVRGVALLKLDHGSGQREFGVYLPAFGRRLLPQAGKSWGGSFPGTDLTFWDLTPDRLADFRYSRAADQKVGHAPCHVVDVAPRDEEVERSTGYGLRRHFIRQDVFQIVRTDYYDSRGRFFKRQTLHDLTRVLGELWQARMALMENHREKLETLIKIDRRVISPEYAPPEIFTPAWLVENRHIRGTGKRPSRQEEAPLTRGPDEAGSRGENP